jgi:hypothetical protein
MRPWSPVRQWLRLLAAFIAHPAGGPSTITIRIRPARDSALREFGERVA